MDLTTLKLVLSALDYRGWAFVAGAMGEGLYLRVEFVDDGIQTGRKWYISTHATRSEVVQTALFAVLTALEHEAREAFTYRGVAIFAPHYNVDRLHELACSHTPDIRTPV